MSQKKGLCIHWWDGKSCSFSLDITVWTAPQTLGATYLCLYSSEQCQSVCTCLVHVLLWVLSPLELFKHPQGLCVVPKWSHPKVHTAVVLRNPWNCSEWPQEVNVSSHWKVLAGQGWLAVDHGSLGVRVERALSLGLYLGVGEPHLFFLRFISQGSPSWCQTHPFSRWWLLHQAEPPETCVHLLQYLDLLFPFSRSQETSPFTKVSCFLFLWQELLTLPAPTGYHCPANTPLLLGRDGSFPKMGFHPLISQWTKQRIIFNEPLPCARNCLSPFNVWSCLSLKATLWGPFLQVRK